MIPDIYDPSHERQNVAKERCMYDMWSVTYQKYQTPNTSMRSTAINRRAYL